MGEVVKGVQGEELRKGRCRSEGAPSKSVTYSEEGMEEWMEIGANKSEWEEETNGRAKARRRKSVICNDGGRGGWEEEHSRVKRKRRNDS